MREELWLLGSELERLRLLAAGVNVAQVMQFFRTKDELFAAVMAIPASALERFGALNEGPDDRLGERVVRAFFLAWEGIAEESRPLMATLRGAFVNDQARDQLRGFIPMLVAAEPEELVRVIAPAIQKMLVPEE
jgi:AcrR family transcriptional regulator